MLIAAARAAEQHRTDRLFDDPLAAVLVEAAGSTADLESVRTLAGEHFVLRTRYFDDYLRDACAKGLRQVVLLASGLDTRPFRLNWPAGVRVFEVDLPDLLVFKRTALEDEGVQACCEHVVVPADLRTDWPDALIRAGFDLAEPTAWLVEGLFMFLPHEANNRLLTWIGVLSHDGSELAVEHVNRAFRELPQMRPVHDRFGTIDAAWRSDVADPVAWLAGHGWRAELTHHVDLARRHGRPVPRLTDPALVGSARIWLASARFDRHTSPNA